MAAVELKDKVARAAERLRTAADSGIPCEPVRDLLGATDIAAAYGVQQTNVKAAYRCGRLRVGRKIGLTAEAVQKQLGVDQPDFGTLLDEMAVSPTGSVPVERLLQPRVEAEVAFRLAQDLDGDFASVDDVRGAIASMAPALEIVDSRVAGWDISIVDTIADNASSGLFVVSDAEVGLDQVEPAEVMMRMTINGTEVSAGTGRACLGDPLNALLWLARTAADVGEPLRAGEIVLSGALGPMVTVRPGDRVHAVISELGSVDVSFASKEQRA